MATEYHLLTWAGLGVTVTFTDSGDIVNMANHGGRNGQALQFPDNGNTLPVGLAKNTTYYLSQGADAGKFALYDTAANAIAADGSTGKIAFSGTGSGTHKVIGAYWATLPETDPGGGGNYKARYGVSGGEKVFSGLYYWFNQLVANADRTKSLILEVQGAWDDTYSTYSAGAILANYFSITITSKNNGVYSDAFHNGVIGSGYRRLDSYNSATINCSSQLYIIIDGIEIINNKAQSTSNYCVSGSAGPVVKNCILQSSGKGVIATPGGNIYNNLIHSCYDIGLVFATYSSGSVAYNNTIVGCGTGISALNGYTHHIINNVCYGNAINWANPPSGGVWANNAGASGDPVFTTRGQGSHVVSAADFKNCILPVTSSSDFSPAGDPLLHTSTSAMVNAGNQLFGFIVDTDICNNIRPSYEGGGATGIDIGAYEFDWGYGPAPLQVTLAISGMAEGSVLAVYQTSNNGAIVSPTTIGASGSHSITYSYTGDTQIIVVVRKGTSGTKYLPYSAPGLITSTGFALIVNQVVDGVLNG